jgi:plasmid maintenance system antidote protein VapI
MAKSFDELVARTTTRKVRAAAKKRADQLLGEMLLSDLRQLTGKTQKDVAEALGIKQPTLARMERQRDIRLTTLGKVVEALGGDLEVLVRLPKGKVRLAQFGKPKRKTRSSAAG